MRKTFKFKAKVSSFTSRKALDVLYLCRSLYNITLEQRKLEYKNYKNHHALVPAESRLRKRLTTFDQSKQLTELKEAFPEYKQIPSQAAQDVVERVGKAYQKFYSGYKTEKVGPPRFKSSDRYHSFTLKQAGWKLEGRHLRVSGIGLFKLRLSREILGTIKTITLKYSCGDWYITFSCDDVPEVKPIGPAKQAVGIDLGLTHFYTDSEGNKVKNPRHLKKHAHSLAEAQRALARKKRGSTNRKKCKRTLSKKHRKVSNSRKDFHYKTAKRLVRNFQTIVMEDLNIKGMITQNKYNKSIHDVGWGEFETILIAKAEEAGRTVLRVNPKNTSQMCSCCGEIVAKDLTVRVHRCACGAEIDRDLNAAWNILKLGGYNFWEHCSEELLPSAARFGQNRSKLCA